MGMRNWAVGVALGVAMIGGPAMAQAPDPTVAHADYANDALWLCRPGLKDDKCKVDLDATVIPGSGKTSVEKFKAVADPKIDCFFVYPTVSLDPGWQSDFAPDHMEFDDIKEQFARFGSVCRQFAPLYRQTTLTVLRAASSGVQPTGERLPQGTGGYNDVVDAWKYYMAHDNKGRGVVLIGHSQGASVIARLIAQEIEGKPAQKQFISGVILGSAVMVPEGKDVGGTYKTIPLCRKDNQIGCVISYMTFRDTNPPPADTRFGKSRNGPARRLHQSGEPRIGQGNAGELLPDQGLPQRLGRGDAAGLDQPADRYQDAVRDHARPGLDRVCTQGRVHLSADACECEP